MISEGVTGVAFQKGSINDLADKLESLMASPDIRSEMGKQARAWVEGERTWSITAAKVGEKISALIKY